MAPNKRVSTKVGGLKRSAQTQATPDSSPRVTTLKLLPHVPAVTLQSKGSPADVHLPHSVPTAPAVQTAPQVYHVPNVPPNVQPNIPPADVHLPPSVPTAPAVPTAPQVNHVPNVPPNVQPNIPPVEQGGSAAPGAATAHCGVPTNPPVNNAVPPQASVPEGLQPPPTSSAQQWSTRCVHSRSSKCSCCCSCGCGSKCWELHSSKRVCLSKQAQRDQD